MKEYNGHRSWNCWSVALWMSNDEQIYDDAIDCLKRAGNNLRRATRYFMRMYGGQKTSDGGIYTHLAVRLALEGFIE